MSTDAPTLEHEFLTAVEATTEGMLVAVRLTPRAGRAAIEEPRREAGGAPRLRVSVSAPPADNLANEALIALLAKSWKIPKSAMSIVAGARGREKKILIRGDAEMLKSRIADFAGDEHG